MKQTYLFRFTLFVSALMAYLYLFDPSFTRFILSAVQVSELNFSDKHLLNSIIWICGFWGILIYLNTPITGLRVTVWTIFIGATFINMIYFEKNASSISIAGFDSVTSILDSISSLSISLVIKFLLVSAMLVSLSLMIKPLSIYTSTWFAVTLVVMALASILIFGEELTLQSVYLVPSVMIHKYLLVGFTYLKDYFKSS